MDSVPVARCNANDDHIRKRHYGKTVIKTENCPDFAQKK